MPDNPPYAWHGYTYSWILPVYIDAVNTLVFDKLSEVAGKCVTIIDDSLTDDVVGRGFGRVSPTTERYNAFNILKPLEVGPLPFGVLED